MSLETALKEVMDLIPGCVFSGYVDLEVGMMLGTHGTEDFTSDVVENLAAAVVNLFESSHSISIENAFRQATGREHDLDPYFRELMVLTPGLVHAFVRAKGNDNHILCFASQETSRPGRVLEAARHGAEQIAAEMS